MVLVMLLMTTTMIVTMMTTVLTQESIAKRKWTTNEGEGEAEHVVEDNGGKRYMCD